MAQVVDKLQPWIAALEGRPSTDVRWLQEIRDKAAARFAALGFPTTRDEEWRFTNVAPIASTEFRPASSVNVAVESIDALPYGNLPFRIALVNGRFSAELSRLENLPDGVRAGSLAAAVTAPGDEVARRYARAAGFEARA